jgi:hypothetical protein
MPAQEQTRTKQPPPAPPPKPVVVEDDPWKPMETAPKTGEYLFLRGDLHDASSEIANEWYWYKTRHYSEHRWKPTGWWRKRFGPSSPPSFTPTGWVFARDGMPT